MVDDPNHAVRILVVDDESAARVSLAEVLRLEGYNVSTAAGGHEVLSLLSKTAPFDLMVLDIKMPGMDGLELTERIHHQAPGTIIILLTAFGELDTAIQAIRHGAHDYLLKPCPIPDILQSVRMGLIKRGRERRRQELVGRLQDTLTELAVADLAEMETETDSESLSTGENLVQVRDIILDPQRHTARAGDQILDLTPTEFKIMMCLMETPDQVWSPQDLIKRVQGYETDAWGARAIVRVHIRRLRKKLEVDPSDPQYILNVRGIGYMLATNPPLGT
jgi:DNA-binding response OmpR family regulator